MPATYDTILPEVLPEVPGCSDMLAIREVRNATIQLCEQALLLKRIVTGQTIAVDVPSVVIPDPIGYKVIDLQSVVIDAGAPLRGASADFLDLVWRDEMQAKTLFSRYHCTGGVDAARDGWRGFKQDRPEVYFLEVDDTSLRIRFVGIPTVAYTTLDYVMRLKPTRASQDVEAWLLEDYFQTIAAGAIASLLALPKQRWTDMNTASVYRARFAEGVEAAKGAATRDFLRDDRTIGRTTAYV